MLLRSVTWRSLAVCVVGSGFAETSIVEPGAGRGAGAGLP